MNTDVKIKVYDLNIDEIVPQQHYLSKRKVQSSLESLSNYESYGDIFVIIYKDKFFCVDGHHRLYNLYKNGITSIKVINELEDNEHVLYKILADEALKLGLSHISDLENRILEHDEFKVAWIDKCQNILKSLK